MERRRFIKYLSLGVAVGSVGTTGCLHGGGTEENEDNGEGEDDGEEESLPESAEVTAGPEGAWRFEPEEVEIAVGGTVEWTFASEGHNVTSDPDADPKCENPEGAEPFKSYEGNNHMSVMEVNSTFSHTFETPGEYTYVCVPHSTQMVGTVRVREQ